jgi:toxin ParE1/3/4
MVEADAWVDRLDAKLRLLAAQPLMGRARDELSPGVRSLPFGRYVIFYLPLSDGIEVLRVLHSAQDFEAIFEKDPPEL